MDINRDNYESWFLDYIEGSLTAGQISQVHQFVAENPDLQQELSTWKQTLLQPDLTLAYPDKEALKKRSRILPIGWIQGLGAVAAVGLLLWLALPLLRREQPGQPAEGVAHTNQQPDRVAAESAVPSAQPPGTHVQDQQQLSGEGGPGPSLGSEPAPKHPNPSMAAAPLASVPNTRGAIPSAQTPIQVQTPVQAQTPVQVQTLGLVQTPILDMTPLPAQVQPRTAQRVPRFGPQDARLAAATPRTAPQVSPIADQETGLADAAPERGSTQALLNDRLPIEVGSLLTTTQSFAQNAGRSLSGFMSGESEWLSILPLPNEWSSESRHEQHPNGPAEPGDDARVLRFSLGGFKVYHRKTTKTDS